MAPPIRPPLPISERGDLIVGNANGNPSRLARGNSGEFIRSDGLDTYWDVVSESDLSTSTTSTKTTDYSAVSTDDVVPYGAIVANRTVTLPDATTTPVGKRITVRSITATRYVVYVDAYSTQTIDGQVTTYPILGMQAVTVSGIKYQVGGTQNGNVKLAIFKLDTSTALSSSSALTVLAQSASTAQGAINTDQTVSFTANITLYPNIDYCACFVTDSATATWMRVSSTAQVSFSDYLMFTKTSFFTLTDTTLSGVGNISAMPFMRLIRA